MPLQGRRYSSLPSYERGLLRVTLNKDSFENVQAATKMVTQKLFVQLAVDEEVSDFDQDVRNVNHVISHTGTFVVAW